MQRTTITFILLLAILVMAVKWGRTASIVASVVAGTGFGFLFIPPYALIAFPDYERWTATFAFSITALVVSESSLRARAQAANALMRKQETDSLHNLSQVLLGVDRFETVAYTVINQSLSIFGASSSVFYFLSSGETHTGGTLNPALTDDLLRKTAEEQELKLLVEPPISVIPLRLGGKPFGTLALGGVCLAETVARSVGHLLRVVLERVQYSEELIVQHQEVVHQRELSESLLLNILPQDVADELRSNGMVAPKYFEDVTIVFTDFVGFTASAEKVPPEDLVRYLNDYFTAFDQICVRYGLEKLKTVGDSYMCLSGLTQPNAGHPVDAVLASLEMLQEVIERDKPENCVRWKMRIGIHTGPVIAGVVGIKKFAFDIWGDTVNFSSRMESSGEANRINISENTYLRIRDFFDCEYRGKVLTKEKREFDMYFVTGVSEQLRSGTADSAAIAFQKHYNLHFRKNLPSFPEFLLSARDTAASLS